MKVSVPDTGDQATNALLETAFKDGAQQAFNEVLSFLEHKYISDPDKPEKGSPEALAILKVARDQGQFIRTTMKQL